MKKGELPLKKSALGAMTLPEGYGKTAIWRRFANGQSGHSANALR